jgi:chromate transporter
VTSELPDRAFVTDTPSGNPGALREVAGVMLRLGVTAFGGPAAHIAMLREQVVTRRRWMSDEHFLDMVGASNLVPGPTSTQTVMHTSYARAGWLGLFVGGACFIAPAALLVLGFAWLYVRYGTTSEGIWLLYGIKPVIIAIVAQAIWGLGRTAVKNVFLAVVGLVVLVLYLLNTNVIVLLFGAAAVVMLVEQRRRPRASSRMVGLLPPFKIALPALGAVVVGAAIPYSVVRLFVTFLKIGAVLYGSGYVLLAFLRANFVNQLGWITNQQLIDSVAVGQFTPGPVFTTATFIGYLVGGVTGAAVATAGIFLPAFAYIALSVPMLPKLRRSPWSAAALDGVNVAAIGLMSGVAWQLGRAAVVDWLTAVLAGVTALLLIRFKLNSAWLVMGGGLIGLAYHAFI